MKRVGFYPNFEVLKPDFFQLNDWLKQKAFEKYHVSAQTGSCESSKSNSPSESTKSMGSAVPSSSMEPRTPEESHCAPEKSPKSTENASPLSSSAEPETPEVRL